MSAGRFTDETGHLHIYDGRDDSVISIVPRGPLPESHLFALDSEKTDPVLEGAIDAWRDNLSTILDGIVLAVRQGQRPVLTLADKQAWDRYFYVQWSRLPDADDVAIPEAETMVERLLEGMRRDYPERREEIDALAGLETRKRIFDEARASGRRGRKASFLPQLAAQGLVVLRAVAAGPGFAIGSLPVLTNDVGLVDTDVSAWLPIASDVVVGPGGEPGEVAILNIDDADVVTRANHQSATQSQSFASASKLQIENLAALVRARR